MPTARSIATGLVPIRSGDVSYPLSRRFVDAIIELKDEDIVAATRAVPSALPSLAAFRIAAFAFPVDGVEAAGGAVGGCRRRCTPVG